MADPLAPDEIDAMVGEIYAERDAVPRAVLEAALAAERTRLIGVVEQAAYRQIAPGQREVFMADVLAALDTADQ